MEAGIQSFQCILDSRFRGSDGLSEFFRNILGCRFALCVMLLANYYSHSIVLGGLEEIS